MRLSLFLALALSACTIQHDDVTAGNYHRISTVGTVGGQGSNQYTPDGGQISTYDTTTSFGNAATAATTLGGGLILGNVAKAKEVTSQVANTNAAKTAQAQISATAATTNATTAARTAVTGQAIQANPAGVTVPALNVP